MHFHVLLSHSLRRRDLPLCRHLWLHLTKHMFHIALRKSVSCQNPFALRSNALQLLKSGLPRYVLERAQKSFSPTWRRETSTICTAVLCFCLCFCLTHRAHGSCSRSCLIKGLSPLGSSLNEGAAQPCSRYPCPATHTFVSCLSFKTHLEPKRQWTVTESEYALLRTTKKCAVPTLLMCVVWEASHPGPSNLNWKARQDGKRSQLVLT